MSACSSGGVLLSTISGLLTVPWTLTFAVTAWMTRCGADVERRIQVVEAFELDGPVAQDREPAALEIVVSANGLDRADQPQLIPRHLARPQVAAERDVHGAQADR